MGYSGGDQSKGYNRPDYKYGGTTNTSYGYYTSSDSDGGSYTTYGGGK